jgi:hypothetical protein
VLNLENNSKQEYLINLSKITQEAGISFVGMFGGKNLFVLRNLIWPEPKENFCIV